MWYWHNFVMLWDVGFIAYSWIWFKSKATKPSFVCAILVSLICECGMIVCVCSNLMKVLLMPEHSLSPSQTLETAWPLTRRLTKL